MRHDDTQTTAFNLAEQYVHISEQLLLETIGGMVHTLWGTTPFMKAVLHTWFYDPNEGVI